MLGDVIAIREEDGDVVARYTYDAWGKVTHKQGTMADGNPFRYRGYYYDTETGFYYLQTRYYDPTICRFINADNYELVAELSQTIGQLNLYAYANNNPIMLTDETGEGFFLIISLIVGAVAGAIIGGVTVANNGATGWGIFGGALLGGVIGVAAGALFAASVSAGIIGVAKAFDLSIKLATYKQTAALGLAIFDIIGAIVGPLMGVDWQLVEWGQSSPNVLPNKNPYADNSRMGSALPIKNNIAQYYIA